jgi:hypothetical protein
MTDNVCRLMETRLCPPSGPCVEVCARFESDDSTPWMEPKMERIPEDLATEQLEFYRKAMGS